MKSFHFYRGDLMEFFARPGQTLIDHLFNVSENMINTASSLPSGFTEQEIEVVKYIGLMHDFGKFTTFFQKKLKGENTRYSEHSYISSIFLGMFLSLRNISKKFIISSMMAVSGHHGKLSNFANLLPYNILLSEEINFNDLFEKHNVFFEQFKDIKKNWEIIKREYKKIDFELFDEMINEDFIISFSKEIVKEYKKIKLGIDYDDYEREKLALETQIFYSILVDSDQKDAAGIKNLPRKEIPENLVDKFLNLNFSNLDSLEINKLRKEFYKAIEENIYKFDAISNEKIFSITAPTGIGKTLAVLNFALKLRKMKEKQFNYTPRIIYSLPYISIIEQTEKVFDSVLSLIPEYAHNKNEYLLPYHHLASYDESEDEEESSKRLLYDTWQSEIILTTFWQIVHTITGFKSALLKKFHTFAGSIVILDEIQAIPIEKLELIEEFLKLLSEELNVTFIIMTATKPVFKKIKIMELNSLLEKTFNFMKRTSIKKLYEEDYKTFEELIDNIDIRDKSALFIFNTIPQSIKNFKYLKELFSDREVFYISTNIVPKDRDIRIVKIDKLIKENKKPILVSTQVVEAGVDLDFDVVFREIGPIPSIIQAAGRSNRNNKLGNRSYVYLTNFEELLSKRVYGSGHIQIALEILNELPNEIPEELYKNIVEKYFFKLKSIISSRKSTEIVEAYKELKFYAENDVSLSDFKIIEERPTVSIFVIQDDTDEEVFKNFLKISRETDPFRRSNLFLRNRREIENRILRIPVDRAKNNLPPCIEEFKNIRFIDQYNLDTFYDLDIGFKFETNTGDSLIW
ncbi:MAG: CRISPR-associated endonuclease/helicase Cas3 [Geotoga sp.]|nr:CRISPR-associated endonuclease/helicase Cas3 [Geotoga sp.]